MIAIGVDIGGTSIKGAAITDKGEILDRFSLKMDRPASPEISFGAMCDEINEFLKNKPYKNEIIGVGLGVPGILNRELGIVKSSPNMPKWINFKISDFVQKKLNLPVKIVNDASSAALGEAKFGTGKNYKNIVMITLGTGVGGGIIIDGKLYDGLGGTGAQLGHSVIRLNGRQCSCGRRGCLEAYASATALIKQAYIKKEKYPDSELNKVENIDAKCVFDLARADDKLAKKLVKEYVTYLSEGLLNICNEFRPDLILLSGGVANEGYYLIKKIESYMKRHNYGYLNAPKVPIKLASLGYDSGKIGAATLFFD